MNESNAHPTISSITFLDSKSTNTVCQQASETNERHSRLIVERSWQLELRKERRRKKKRNRRGRSTSV